MSSDGSEVLKDKLDTAIGFMALALLGVVLVTAIAAVAKRDRR